MRELEVGPEERGRYDLYIVSENLQQEEEEETKESRRKELLEEKTGGHINQSFAPSEPEEEVEVEEEERRDSPGEIIYTALSRATTAIVSLQSDTDLICWKFRDLMRDLAGKEGKAEKGGIIECRQPSLQRPCNTNRMTL